MKTSASESNQRKQRAADLAANMPLVRKLVAKMRMRLPASVDRDDLMQAGLIGLNDALSRFETGHNSSFETYAARRISGAMLDELRANDPLPRRARAQVRSVGVAVQRLEQRLGRPPRAKEIANELDWPLEKFHACMVKAGAGGRRDGDEALEHLPDASSSAFAADGPDVHAYEHSDPMLALQQRQRHVALNAAFDALEAADRFVMEAVYDRGLRLRDVGETLGLSESRISQKTSEIIAKLKQRIHECEV
jgi:RNA polymerase sigma factor for flagellar operon FliA